MNLFVYALSVLLPSVNLNQYLKIKCFTFFMRSYIETVFVTTMYLKTDQKTSLFWSIF
jgi:hypothetical protein